MEGRITKWNRWANAHTTLFTDALRILFGLYLFCKGVLFWEETDYLNNLFSVISGKGTYFILVHYVALGHLCGGVFIIVGLLTRLCALAQLPILVGAVTVNFLGVMNVEHLVESIVAFFTCAFFVFYGSGRHSVDHTLRLHV